jgi:2-oxoglutarate dehydrogenase E1 component
MTPKSLLRHPKVISPISDLVDGRFVEVLDDSSDPGRIDRILLCSGKVYYDLLAQREACECAGTAVIRMEQLYPFPHRALGVCLERYSHLSEVTWVQEEPRNYGAWTYMHERFGSYFPRIDLRYLGRGESASSEPGSFKQYQAQQKKLVEDAFSLSPVSDAASKQ